LVRARRAAAAAGGRAPARARGRERKRVGGRSVSTCYITLFLHSSRLLLHPPARPPLTSHPAMSLSPYEKEREARVARNKDVLRELGVKHAAALLAPPIAAWRRSKPAAGARKRVAVAEVAAAAAEPVRSSRRVRARTAPPAQPGDAEAEPLGELPAAGEDDSRRLLTCDEWLERQGLPKGAPVRPPFARAAHRLPRAADDRPVRRLGGGVRARGAGAGGVGCGANARPPAASPPHPLARSRRRGRRTAAATLTGAAPRARAPRSLRAACLPRTQTPSSTGAPPSLPPDAGRSRAAQAQRAWRGGVDGRVVGGGGGAFRSGASSAAPRRGSLRAHTPRRPQVATAHGCGNKWGLFASHIPHRVGYQCSAAYRHILIPRVRQRAQPLPRAALRLAPAARLSRGRSLGGHSGTAARQPLQADVERRGDLVRRALAARGIESALLQTCSQPRRLCRLRGSGTNTAHALGRCRCMSGAERIKLYSSQVKNITLYGPREPSS